MKFRSFINEKSKCPKDGCIQKKTNGKWGVISGKTGKFWDADYDTKEDAEKGLKAYFVRKENLSKSLGNTKLNENIGKSKYSLIGNPNEEIPIIYMTRGLIEEKIDDFKEEHDLGKCTQKDFDNYIKNVRKFC
jgi:hypothetical protein